ncbi:MAG TPA: FKBP-type peptidyl-prolyl cis-trans isomerase [Fulvivirga sp.]|nr:FKBP-type peptidyl-prolyl cis-trans isomerase [Fulvivirga sp.]
MKIIKLVTIAVIVGLLQSCGDSEKSTPSGLKYSVINEGSEIANDGDYLLLNMIYKDDNDSVWVDSKERGIPMVIMKEDSIWNLNDGSVQEVFATLKKGDSIKFDVTAEDLFAKTWKAPLPPNVKPETMITFLIGVKDILDKDGLMQWQQEMMAKQQKDAVANAEKQKSVDDELITKYLEDNNITANTTESGLRYVITQEGTGANAEAGKTVKVNYSGKILDGEYFDTSVKELAEKEGLYNEQRTYEPIEFQLGTGAVIKGWDEGIALLNPGAKATFYIPSGLAYGPRARSAKIPANSILVFDVELVEVK